MMSNSLFAYISSKHPSVSQQINTIILHTQQHYNLYDWEHDTLVYFNATTFNNQMLILTRRFKWSCDMCTCFDCHVCNEFVVIITATHHIALCSGHTNADTTEKDYNTLWFGCLTLNHTHNTTKPTHCITPTTFGVRPTHWSLVWWHGPWVVRSSCVHKPVRWYAHTCGNSLWVCQQQPVPNPNQQGTTTNKMVRGFSVCMFNYVCVESVWKYRINAHGCIKYTTVCVPTLSPPPCLRQTHGNTCQSIRHKSNLEVNGLSGTLQVSRWIAKGKQHICDWGLVVFTTITAFRGLSAPWQR